MLNINKNYCVLILLFLVPGTPENVSYNMVNCYKRQNYCHVNITWSHPYNQNAIITSFDINLYETSQTNMTVAFKSILEILNVYNKEYQATYSHMVSRITQ